MRNTPESVFFFAPKTAPAGSVPAVPVGEGIVGRGFPAVTQSRGISLGETADWARQSQSQSPAEIPGRPPIRRRRPGPGQKCLDLKCDTGTADWRTAAYAAAQCVAGQQRQYIRSLAAHEDEAAEAARCVQAVF